MGGKEWAGGLWRQTVDSGPYNTKKKKTNKSQHLNLIKIFASQWCGRGGEFSHWKQDFKYGSHQRYCMRNVPILTYKVPWDSLDGKHHINTSIIISRGRSQTADISA